MKRLLVMLVLFFLSFSVLGCTSKENTYNIEQISEILLDLTHNSLQYEYLEWEDEYMVGGYLGNCDMLLYIENDEINKIYLKDGEVFYFTIYLEEPENRKEIEVWYISFEYANYNNETYLYLEYYDDAYEAETLDYSFNEFVNNLNLFDIDDYLNLLIELGYEDILEPIEIN